MLIYILKGGRLWLLIYFSVFLAFVRLTSSLWYPNCSLNIFSDLKLITLQCFYLSFLGSSIFLGKLPWSLLLNTITSCPIWFSKFLNDTAWVWIIVAFFTTYSLIKVSRELNSSLLVFLCPWNCWWKSGGRTSLFCPLNVAVGWFWLLHEKFGCCLHQDYRCLNTDCSNFVYWSCPHNWLKLDSQDNYQISVSLNKKHKRPR